MAKQTTHRGNRKRLGKKLRAQGIPEEEVLRILARKAEDQRRQREIERLATDRPTGGDLDDSGYQPARVDSTLTGVARATGETARAVRRGKTITRHEHREVSDGR